MDHHSVHLDVHHPVSKDIQLVKVPTDILKHNSDSATAFPKIAKHSKLLDDLCKLPGPHQDSPLCKNPPIKHDHSNDTGKTLRDVPRDIKDVMCKLPFNRDSPMCNSSGSGGGSSYRIPVPYY